MAVTQHTVHPIQLCDLASYAPTSSSNLKDIARKLRRIVTHNLRQAMHPNTGGVVQNPKPTISLVVAVARNGVIGRDNGLPWHLPDDLKRFKAITLGKPVVMGRKTFESIGRPLPGRENRVVSRQPGLVIEGCKVFSRLDEAFMGPEAEIMIIGGADIYAQALPVANRLYLTEVNAQLSGDARFPALDPGQWREISSEPHAADERHAHAFVFRTLERV